jgi:hypothetical protein
VRLRVDQVQEAEDACGTHLMPKTLADLARTAHQLPRELQAAEQRGVRKSALLVTRGIRDEVRAATGDNRLSGVGRRGARVGAKYDVSGGTNPTAVIRATGPLHLIDRDTDPHTIAPRKRRGAKALRLANGSFAASVRHPGTRGKHVWGKGIGKTRAGTRRVFANEIHTAMVKAIS